MERKSSAYLNSDDMFSTYAQETYMENISCELASNRSTQRDNLNQATCHIVAPAFNSHKVKDTDAVL